MRALAIDRERRDAVGRSLDGDGREDERGHSPFSEHDRNEGGDRHEHRDGIDVADPREPVGDVGANARPVLRQPHVHVLVAVAEAVLGKRVRLERPTGQERRRRQQHEPNDGDHQVGPHGVPGHRAADPRRDAPRLEARAPTGAARGRLGVCVPVRTRSLLLDSHDHARFPGSRCGQTDSCAGDRPDTDLDSGGARRVAVRRRGASHVVGPCPGRRRRGGGPRAHARRPVRQEPARCGCPHRPRADAGAGGDRARGDASSASSRSPFAGPTRSPASTPRRLDGPRRTAPRRPTASSSRSRTWHRPPASS